MARPSNPLFAFLSDSDLLEFLWNFALKLMRNEADAKDIRQGALKIAMELVLVGKGPREGRTRPWLCRVLKNHALSEWRKKKGDPAAATREAMGEYPAEDERELNEEQRELERLHATLDQTLAKYPEKAAQVQEADGRQEAVAAKDATARKRRERARTFLASTISAAMAAAVFFLIVRDRLKPQPVPGMTWNDSTLATGARKLALQRCAMSAWEACLFGLEEAKRLDAAGDRDPGVQRARLQAVSAARAEAMSACLAEQWRPCLDGLDVARRYDRAGDEVPLIQLARSEAARRVNGAPVEVEDRSKNGPAP